jgi:hypothetical protein
VRLALIPQSLVFVIIYLYIYPIKYLFIDLITEEEENKNDRYLFTDLDQHIEIILLNLIHFGLLSRLQMDPIKLAI